MLGSRSWSTVNCRCLTFFCLWRRPAKSVTWWCGCIVLGTAALQFQNKVTSHVNWNKSNTLNAAELEFQARDHEHSAVQLKLQSYLCWIKAEALSRNAALLNDEMTPVEISARDQEKRAQEYKEIWEQAQDAIHECELRIQADTKISDAAHQRAQDFMDEMCRLESEFAQACADFSEMICDIVARAKGLNKQEKDLAVQALKEEEDAYAADKDKEMEESMEQNLEKNATLYEKLASDANHYATQLRDAYKRDELREQYLDGNATFFSNRSHAEIDMAKMETKQAEQDRIEAIEFTQMARFHGQKSRLYAIFAVLTGVAVFCIFTDYLVHLLGRLRRRPTGPTKPEPPGNESDASTVASSIPSEESPLVVSVVEGSSNDSYFTIDLTTQLPPDGNSLSSSDGSFISQLRSKASEMIQWLAPFVERWAPSIELALVLVFVAFSGHLLFFKILPSLHDL